MSIGWKVTVPHVERRVGRGALASTLVLTMRSLTALPLAALSLAAVLLPATLARSAAAEARPLRIVSLNPSLTSILLALDAKETLVGIDDYSAGQNPELDSLPRVGGLFSPSLEAVVALRPDLVVLVPSAEQRDFRSRVEALSVKVEVFDNIHFEQVIENVERLGAIVGRSGAAVRRVEEIRSAQRRVRALAAELASPRVLLVLQRDPIYVAGRGSFIEEMVSALGGENIANELDDPYPRVASEWVVDRAPDVLIDLSPDNAAASDYWSRWSSIPAVRDARVIAVDAALVSMPGPYLDRSLAVLGGALYGESIAAQIRGAAPPTRSSAE